MMPAPRIGPYQLDGPVVLAPMAGITDAPFRRLCREQGASLAASEMTTADMDLWQTRKSRQRLSFGDDLHPRVVQIAGSEPEQLARGAKFVVARGADIVDINMGCPAKKVCRRLAGSALLRDPDLVRRILDSVVSAVTVPVTLKMRTGWDPQHRNGVAIARIAEQAGIQSIAVHGRTRACAYRGNAEYDTIKNIKEAVSIPVFANGDINSPAKAVDVLLRTGADGIMIGRAARGTPWFFSQVLFYMREKKFLSTPAPAIQRDIVLRHLDAMYGFYGKQHGVRVARKHLAWYSEHLESGQQLRQRAVRTETTSEQMRLIRDIFADRGDGENAESVFGLPGIGASGADIEKENRETQETFEIRGTTGQCAQTSATRLHRRSRIALFP